MDEDGKKTEGHTPWPKLRFITEDDEANATIVPVDDGWKPWFTMHAVGPCGVEDRLCAAVVDAMNERSALLKCEEALRPFAEAWAIANRHKTPMTLAEFGALAMHHCSSVDFRKAHAALTLLDEVRK